MIKKLKDVFFYIFIFFLHIGIFSYASEHIHLFESPEVFSALGKDEKAKQFKAIALLFCLLLYWLYLLWQGLKFIFGSSDKVLDMNHVSTNIDVNKTSDFLAPTYSVRDSALKVDEFEQRMGYKAKPLSEEQQDLLEAKFRAAARMKKWPE
jgi:hypothetical protein